MSNSTELNKLEKALAERLIRLAETSLLDGRLKEAERLYRELLHFLELILGPCHIDRANTLYKLAYILELQENNAQSQQLLSQARAIVQKVSGTGLPIYMS